MSSRLLKESERCVKEQPEDVERTLLENWSILEEVSTQIVENSPDVVILTGLGDSYFVALAARYAFEQFTDYISLCEEGFEFAHYLGKVTKNSIVIIISASGRTATTLSAARRAKNRTATVISVTNSQKTPLSELSDFNLVTKAVNPAGMTTKTSTTAMALLYGLSLSLGKCSGYLAPSRFEILKNELFSVKGLMHQVLQDQKIERMIIQLTQQLVRSPILSLVGGGPGFVTSLFLMSKVKELLWRPVEVYQLEEFCHYPMLAIEAGMPVGLCIQPGSSRERMLNLLQALNEIKAYTFGVCKKDDYEIKKKCSNVVEVPEIAEIFSPLLYGLPYQLLVISMTKKLKITADGFRYGEVLTDLIGYE
ncbi:MAG: SIS domain-containing protein [Promethearchaeota archaeon]